MATLTEHRFAREHGAARYGSVDSMRRIEFHAGECMLAGVSSEKRPDLAEQVDAVLARLRAGDASARDELYPLVLAELHDLASRRMARNNAHTLQATALVNEAFLRLWRDESKSWNDRKHFFRAASLAMRSVLVDHARRAKAGKRLDPSRRVELDPEIVADFESRAIDLLALDEALGLLRTKAPDLAELVNLRFFGGRSLRECADLMSVSERTARREWSVARAFLRRQLDANQTGGDEG